MNAARQTAVAAWGDAMPDWVAELSSACAMTSQNRVAKQLGVSAAMVSTVLANKYPGDMGRIEDLVRGHFMNGTINCHALGEIPTNVCRDWREKARNFGSANSQRVQMFRACNACAHNQQGEQK